MTILDRIEDGIACLSVDGTPQKCDAALLDASVAEGDVLFFDGVKWQCDREATSARRAQMKERLNRLIKREKE